MNNQEFEAKLNSIESVDPDSVDIAMIENAKAINDGTLYSMDEVKERIFNGKISLRIPKSLHKELVEKAKQEGVSLNQYALFKLSH